MTKPRGAASAFMPLAVVFGVLTLVFLPLGQSLWIAFMPLAAAFAVLAVRSRDEGEADEDFIDDSP